MIWKLKLILDKIIKADERFKAKGARSEQKTKVYDTSGSSINPINNIEPILTLLRHKCNRNH